MNARRQWLRSTGWACVGGVFFLWAGVVHAQRPASPTQPPSRFLPQEGIYLVFPFENIGAASRLDWIGEGLEELTIERLSAAGEQVYTHTGRLNQMDVYGFPASAKLSRAAMLHIAQDMDADYVIYGNFSSDGKTLTVNARVLSVSPTGLLPAVNERGPLESLIALHNQIAWRLLSSSKHEHALSLAEFEKAQRALSLAAFEQYIRGLLGNDDETRLRDLKEASRLEPEWPDPAFAIGQMYAQRNDCSSALPWLMRVPANDSRSLEALFTTGVCRLVLGQPDKAEEVFTSLQDTLHRNMISGAEVPEILNNLGLARARQGDTAGAHTALGRAGDIDPDEDDYPFNLGLLAVQSNDLATAVTHFREAVRREPDNGEDAAFLIQALEKSGRREEAEKERKAADEAFGGKGLPAVKLDVRPETLARYERVMRDLDLAALRLDLQSPVLTRTADGAAIAVKDTPAGHLRLGHQQLRAGRFDLAEQEFRAVLTIDPKNASAHRELGEIYRRRGKLDDAVKELQLSLAVRDSAAVRTTLARIYLEEKKPDLARAEVAKAVKLAPNYTEAKELLEHLEKSKPAGGAQ